MTLVVYGFATKVGAFQIFLLGTSAPSQHLLFGTHRFPGPPRISQDSVMAGGKEHSRAAVEF